MFVSVDGKAKEVKEIFAGGQDGKAHRVTELFGSVDGIAKRLYTITKETNAFDEFTWAEIKQLANEGKLLEHFNMYDRVTVKLTETLTNKCTYHSSIKGTTTYFYPKQDRLILQITALTETSMRLSSPCASIFWKNIQPGVWADDGLTPWEVSTTTSEPFEGSSNITITTVDYGDSCFWKINDVLPEDLKEVAKKYERTRKTVTYSGSGTITTKDYTCIRNLSAPINFKVTKHTDTMPYWYEITESQFPKHKSAYLYHFAVPEDCNYLYWCGNGQTFLYSKEKSEYYRTYYITKSPKVTWGHTDKYTSPSGGNVSTLRSYQYAQQQGNLGEHFHSSLAWDFIPELSIEADAE